MSAKWKSRLARLWKQSLQPLLVFIFMICCFRSAVADWNDVPTGSMEPTILIGDRIVVNKLAYDLKVPFTLLRVAEWSDPEAEEIIVLRSPVDQRKLVKRVIAVPGDLIAMRAGRLTINGTAIRYGPLPEAVASELEDDAISFFQEHLEEGHAIAWDSRRVGVRHFGPVRVPEGHYFVMGDNRDNSLDSRRFGFVARNQVLGRAVAVAFSLDYDKWWFRPGRWFRGLR